MLVIHEDATVVTEPPPHGAIGLCTAYRISDAAPRPRAMEFRKRVLHVGAAIGVHPLTHDEVFYVLAGEGEVTSDGETQRVTAGMAAYLYEGAEVGIRQVGEAPLTIIVSYPNRPAAALPPNRSVPDAVVLPELPYRDVTAAADWLCRAFGFSVRLRIGDHRVQMNVPGGGAVIVKQGDVVASSNSVMVRVADVEAHHAHAVAAGADAGAPTTYPFGERQYGVRDLAGHAWVFTQSVADVDPADWGGVLVG